MTETASIIAEIEAATTPGEKKTIRSNHPNDELFADFLRWTLDPFRQYGFSESPWDFAPLDDPTAINAALASEWTSWLEVLDALYDGDAEPDVIEPWKKSAAWPIYQRCIWKRIDGLANGTANALRSSVGAPLFQVGIIGTGDVPSYPVWAEPVLAGARRIVVVHNPYSGSGVKVDTYNTQGVCRNFGFPSRIRDAFQAFKWGVWLNVEKAFSNGVLLDGVVWKSDDTKMFQVVDVVPLSKFRKQNQSETYSERRIRLTALAEIVKPGADPFYPVPGYECADADALQGVVSSMEADQKRGRIKGVVAKLPHMSYPYKKSLAWVWVSRAEKR